MKSDTISDVPSVQRSLNMSTDWGLIGDEKSIGTSAGRKILLEFCAFRILVASTRRNTAETTRSTICSLVMLYCFIIWPILDLANVPSAASSSEISSPGPSSPSTTVEMTVSVPSLPDLSSLSKRFATSPTMAPKTIKTRISATQVFITFLIVLRRECEA